IRIRPGTSSFTHADARSGATVIAERRPVNDSQQRSGKLLAANPSRLSHDLLRRAMAFQNALVFLRQLLDDRGPRKSLLHEPAACSSHLTKAISILKHGI